MVPQIFQKMIIQLKKIVAPSLLLGKLSNAEFIVLTYLFKTAEIDFLVFLPKKEKIRRNGGNKLQTKLGRI